MLPGPCYVTSGSRQGGRQILHPDIKDIISGCRRDIAETFGCGELVPSLHPMAVTTHRPKDGLPLLRVIPWSLRSDVSSPRLLVEGSLHRSLVTWPALTPAHFDFHFDCRHDMA